MPRTLKRLSVFKDWTTNEYRVAGHYCGERPELKNFSYVMGNTINVGRLHAALVKAGLNPTEWEVSLHPQNRSIYVFPSPTSNAAAEEVDLLSCWLCQDKGCLD